MLLVAGMFFEDRLIAFEERLLLKLDKVCERIAAVAADRYRARRAYIRDAKAIHRACKRQSITFRRFVAMLWEERRILNANEHEHTID